MNDNLHLNEDSHCYLTRRGESVEHFELKGLYVVECLDAEGNFKWLDVINNLITTVGKNDVLDKYLKGSSYTQTIRMGLKGAGSAAAGDTQASHSGWSELTDYTGNRKDVTMGSASSGSSVSPSQSFAITGTMTVAGVFINNGGSATKSDTSGTLFSVGNFSGGDRSVISGDTINVTYTLSA